MPHPASAETKAADAAAETMREMLSKLFGSLRELYVYCEREGRADIGGEVIDALSMCQQDFSVLVDRLRAQGDSSAPDIDGDTSLAVSPGSPPSPSTNPSLTASSPLTQLNSPESNTRMLEALETLKFDELAEAARYFEVAGPMLARKAHEALYLERAKAEGREAAARKFLVTLNRMAQGAAKNRSAEKPLQASKPATGSSTAPPKVHAGAAATYSTEPGDGAPAVASAEGCGGRVRDSPPHTYTLPYAHAHTAMHTRTHWHVHARSLHAILRGIRARSRFSNAPRARSPQARFALPASVYEGKGETPNTEGEDGLKEEDGEEGWEVQSRQKRQSRRRRLWPAQDSGGGADVKAGARGDAKSACKSAEARAVEARGEAQAGVDGESAEGIATGSRAACRPSDAELPEGGCVRATPTHVLRPSSGPSGVGLGPSHARPLTPARVRPAPPPRLPEDPTA